MKRSSLARTFAATALLLAPILWLAGCADSGSRIEQANRDGILHWGNGTEIQDLDPQVVTGVPEHKVIMALIEGLVMEDPVDLSPEPGVAERWEVSEDGRTYTFHLRRDAKWTNGDPVTAEDFLLSYKRILTQSLAAEYANMIYDYVDKAADYYFGRITDFSEVGFKVVDPYTFQVRLAHPTPYFLRILASHYSWWPVPIKVVEKFGGLDRKGSAWTRPENFVGNGPFRLKEWHPNQVLVVEKNPLYWDADRVRLQEIRFYPVESQDTEERMFRTGQLHHTNEVPLSKIDAYKRDNPELIRIEPYLGSYFYRLNVTRPPLNDVRVRRALALAIDRESLVTNVTRGGQNPAYNFTPVGFPDYHPKARLAGTLEEARRLLAEAGYPEGKGIPPIELLYNTSENHRVVAEAIQQMWRTGLGIDVRLTNKEWKVYLDAQDTLDYSICRAGWIGDYVDPHTFLEIFVTGGGNNDTGWSNAEYDSLREQALRASDDASRFAIYERMEQILIDEVPIIPIYHYTRVYLQHPSVKGYYPTILDNHPFKYVWLETPEAN
ncbi:peptide ABC transporter substrate-binding protein [Opitutales bacterium ASA1]|uniref:peptide ABC transporter substrate-binding protein n=1 Tax=Congregicoccus parvus TaxID=3081749 RepID=UPI002B29E35A|nr:peptide ABC transporter substrate-binding protein [Opitutales bacterium ASA1]